MLDAIVNGEDPAGIKQRRAEARKADAKSKKSTKTDDEPAPVRDLDPQDGDDLAGFTVRQLKALADRKGIAVPTSAKKAELVAIVRDGLADSEAA